jgi:hypothetical protein
MRRAVMVALLLSAIAAALPAAASEAVIRGGTISIPPSRYVLPGYSGSSRAPAPPTTVTVLRGVQPNRQETAGVAPPGAETQYFGSSSPSASRVQPNTRAAGPIYYPACLYTEPPTCR